MNYTTFENLPDFYKWWDKQNHTKHTEMDFALRILIVSSLKDEEPEKTISRLKAAFPPVHSTKKWCIQEYPYPRYRFDGLVRVLYQISLMKDIYPRSGTFAHNALFEWDAPPAQFETWVSKARKAAIARYAEAIHEVLRNDLEAAKIAA